MTKNAKNDQKWQKSWKLPKFAGKRGEKGENDEKWPWQESKKRFTREGICEECGATDILYKIDGRLICESCKNSI